MTLTRLLAALFAALMLWMTPLTAVAEVDAASPEELLEALTSQVREIDVALEGQVGSARIEEFRASLEAHRQELVAASKVIADELDPLRAEMEALGPAPEDGATESAEIAEQRAELGEKISSLDALAKRIQSAIAQIEALRERLVELRREHFTRQLLERQPTPVSPERIASALESIETRASVLRREIRARINKDGAGTLIDRLALPMFLAFAAFGLAIWLRRRLIAWIRIRVGGEQSRSRRARLTAAITLVRLILPTVGIAMALVAVRQSGLVGPYGMVVTTNIGFASAVMILGYAFGSAYFAPGSRGLRISGLSDGRAVAAYRWYIVLVILVALDQLLVASGKDLRLSTDALSVINAVLLVLSGATLWGFVGNVGLGQRSPAEDTDETLRDVHMVGRVSRVVLHFVAVTAPLLALIGYFGASRFVFYPMVHTAAVLGAVVLIYLWVVAISMPDPRTQEPAEEGEEGEAPEEPKLSVLPVLAGFTLTVLALPMLAVVWGAKATDLQSAWTVVIEGFRVGDISISPMDFMIFAIVFAIGYFITRIVQGVLRRSVFPVVRIDPGAKAALLAGVGYVGFIVSALVAISTTALDLSNLAIVFGALSVGIGFGLQNVVNNFVSGVILLIERPIKVGDWVELGGQHGIVRRINVRSTQIQRFDRSTMFVPNADLISGVVTNWYHGAGQGRLVLKIGVAYGSDVRLVEKILLEAAAAHPMVLRDPEPFVIFADFGASSLDFELRGIMADVNMILTLPSELRFSIYKRFDEEGIEIPYAQSDVTIRNLDEVAALVRNAGRDASER